MGRIIRLGEYWSTGTFLFYTFLGIYAAVCCRYAAPIELEQKGVRIGSTVKYRQRGMAYVVLFAIMWVVYAFRDASVGADTETYIGTFLLADKFHFDLNRFLILKQNEPMFDILTITIRKITDNYVIYFAIIGVFIAYGYIRFFETFWSKGKSTIFLALFVLMYQYNLSALRTAIGETFLLLALCQLAERKNGKAILLSFVGGLFHYTIWINLFFIVFHKMISTKSGFKRVRLLLLTLSSITVFGVIAPALKAFFLATRYRAYIPAGNRTIYGYWYIFFSLILSYLMVRKIKRIEDEKVAIAVTASCFSVILVFVSSMLGTYRLVGYYALTRYYMWDRSADIFFKRKENRIMYSVIIVCVVAFMLLYQLGRNSEIPGFAYRIEESM